MAALKMRLVPNWILPLFLFVAGCSAAGPSRDAEGSGASPSGTGATTTAGGASSTGGSSGSGDSQSSTGGSTPLFGDTGNNVGGGDTTFPGCDTQTYEGERLPMDMYIMFDQSLSMSCATPSGVDRWTAVRTAMEAFVNDPSAQDIGVGIGYFGAVAVSSGQPQNCDPAAYEIPDAEIAPLPGNAQAIIDSLGRHGPSSTTPTPPALAGALNHAIAWRNGTGRPTIVVLVTDGQPNDCGVNGATATPQDVATVAAAGLSGAGMQTYVLGIIAGGVACDWDGNPPNVADLDLVASSGGTNTAFIVDASQDVASQFLDKMNQIRSSAQLPCQYSLPTGQTTVDVTKVNLSYTAPGATDAQPLLYASDPSVCDPATGGWYYDNPSAPTSVLLCPATCDVIKLQIGGQIGLVLGCPTKPIQ